jgi:hypothetical protein
VVVSHSHGSGHLASFPVVSYSEQHLNHYRLLNGTEWMLGHGSLQLERETGLHRQGHEDLGARTREWEDAKSGLAQHKKAHDHHMGCASFAPRDIPVDEVAVVPLCPTSPSLAVPLTWCICRPQCIV